MAKKLYEVGHVDTNRIWFVLANDRDEARLSIISTCPDIKEEDLGVDRIKNGIVEIFSETRIDRY